MKKQTRTGVFETNSSSTHSLVLCESNNLLPQPFSDNITEQGVVTASAGEFGWNEETFTSVYDKLSYLYTDAMQYADGNDEPNPAENEKLRMIVDAVKDHTGCVVGFAKSGGYWDYGYIDHQSVGLCEEVWEKGVEGVKQFLFNPESYFETDNDNH